MKHLTRGDQKRLLALAEGVLGNVDPHPRDTQFLQAVDDNLSHLGALDRQSLRLVLRLLQWSPLIYGGLRPFAALDASARQRHFERLAGSRVSFFRRLFQVVRTLIAYNYYGQTESWPAIGYDGPWIGRVDVERLSDPELGEGERR